MIGDGAFRGEQKKNQVDRLVVYCFERDRALEAREDPIEPREPGQLAVRDPDPHPDSGAAEPFTFDQHIVDRALVQTTQRRSAPGKLLQSVPFVCRAQLSDHTARRYQIGDTHLSRRWTAPIIRGARLVRRFDASSAPDPVRGRSTRYCRRSGGIRDLARHASDCETAAPAPRRDPYALPPRRR